MVPKPILQLIAEYATGKIKIYECTDCYNEIEILIMNDRSIYYSNNNNSSYDKFTVPPICCGNECNTPLFCCNKISKKHNQCTNCENDFCQYCISECSFEHPCCDDCLLSCAGGNCGVGTEVCYQCNEVAIDNSLLLAMWQCDKCKNGYCGHCTNDCGIKHGNCSQCHNEICGECCPDWFCTNAKDCKGFSCMDCNKHGICKCKSCKKKYCRHCIETCDNCGKYYCQQCKGLFDGVDICSRCARKCKKSNKSSKSNKC